MGGITKEILFGLFQDHTIYHTSFQIDNFIVGKTGVTLYGMYKQALRELYSRWESLKVETIDIRILRLEISELENRIETKPKTERAKLELLKKRLALDSNERQISHRIREFCRFYYQAIFMKGVFGELTKEDHEKLDREMWIAKIRRHIVVDVLSGGRVSNATIETILGLPDDLKSTLLSDVEQPHQLVSAEREKDSSLPVFEVGDAEIEEVRKQLEC